MCENGRNTTGNYIYYDPVRRDYTVTEDELNRLCDAGRNHWKDFCLISFSLGIPFLMNAIGGTPHPFFLSLLLFLNYLVGTVCILVGLACSYMWRKSSRGYKTLLAAIKNKPKMKVEIQTSTSGSNPIVLTNNYSPNKP